MSKFIDPRYLAISSCLWQISTIYLLHHTLHLARGRKLPVYKLCTNSISRALFLVLLKMNALVMNDSGYQNIRKTDQKYLISYENSWIKSTMYKYSGNNKRMEKMERIEQDKNKLQAKVKRVGCYSCLPLLTFFQLNSKVINFYLLHSNKENLKKTY